MPELPEVEVTRRGIAAPLLGARIEVVRVGKPLRWPLGIEPGRLVGGVLGDVTRRGKYLWLPVDLHAMAALPVATVEGPTPVATTAPVGGLLLHLGMSGSLSWLPRDRSQAPGPHDHFDLVTASGTLRLRDPRRFGAVVWSQAIGLPPASTLLHNLGPEPFDPELTPARFHAALQKRSAPIKAVLLSGIAVVGAGNIYACEALFHAGIHPSLAAHRISRPRAARLLAALRSTLGQALQLGGSTLRDFTDVHGASGGFQSVAAVYGREGAPCIRCSAALRRTVQGQRATYFCRVCQRR